MDASDALAELDASDEQGVVHELHLRGTHEWQLLGQVMLEDIASHGIHLGERNGLAEDESSVYRRKDGEPASDRNHTLERAGYGRERGIVLVLHKIIRIERVDAMETHTR